MRTQIAIDSIKEPLFDILSTFMESNIGIKISDAELCTLVINEEPKCPKTNASEFLLIVINPSLKE